MPIPTDFRQDDAGDLALPLRHTEGIVEYVTQKLSQTFNFWKGEWFLNLNAGLPMFELVIGQPYDAALVQSIFQDAALKTRAVSDVFTIATAFDSGRRVLSVDPIGVIAIDGTEVPDPGPFVIGARN